MTLKNNLFAFVIVSMVAAAGCAPRMQFQQSPLAMTNADEELPPSPIDQADSVPECVVNPPQVNLTGHVNGFEFTSSVGVTFGYNNGTGHTGVGGTASVKIDRAQMDLSVFGLDPMTSTPLATTDIGSAQTTTNINAEIDFSQFAITPSLFYQTPLAKVVDKGLASALSNVKDQMDKLPWVGRVMKHLNEQWLQVNAGTRAGLMTGDKFSVFNVTHFWSDQPCISDYQGSVQDSSVPAATIEIINAGEYASIGRIVGEELAHVRRGAEIRVSELVPAPKGQSRYLKKRATIGKIQANNFLLPGGTSFDFEGAMNVQIIDALNKNGAFIFTVK